MTSALLEGPSSRRAGVPGTPARRVRRSTPRNTLTPGRASALGVAMMWFSLLVLIPLTAVVVDRRRGRLGQPTSGVLTQPADLGRGQLTVLQAFLVTCINIVMGTIIAWVLVRDRFPGKVVLDVVIDVPFALPTIVAGLVLLSLYGPNSPMGVHWAFTEHAVSLALAVRDAAVRRADRPARARGARGRRRGGRGLARRQAVDDLPADHPAEPGARRSPPAPRCPSRARSRSTARWCCSRATGRSRPRWSRCAC